MAPFFYGWGSTASRLQPLRGGSLLFTIQWKPYIIILYIKDKFLALSPDAMVCFSFLFVMLAFKY